MKPLLRRRILLVCLVAAAACSSIPETIKAGESYCTGTKAECAKLAPIHASLREPQFLAAVCAASPESKACDK